MGSFASSSSCGFCSRNGDGNKINPTVLEITLANLNTTRSALNDGYKRQRTLFNNIDYPAFNQESDRSRILSTYPNGLANLDPSSHDSPSSTYSSASYQFDLENLRSFDGMNKKVINRYDIGLDILKAKIHFGADPKSLCTHGGRTCLMFSVMANDLSFTKQLVELGVDINRTNQLNETALSLAIELKREEIAKYLRAQGAKKVHRQIRKKESRTFSKSFKYFGCSIYRNSNPIHQSARNWQLNF